MLDVEPKREMHSCFEMQKPTVGRNFGNVSAFPDLGNKYLAFALAPCGRLTLKFNMTTSFQ